MKIRLATTLAAALLIAAFVAPAAIAADLSDVGYVDQAQLASMPVFVSANQTLAAYKQQLDAQFASTIKNAKSDADKQRISMQFQQQYSDKQREIVGPVFQRAQLAIAAVSATRNVSVVVDKRIVVYGGQDLTKDVQTLFSSNQAISPPTASPPPSEIGYVDQNALDAMPKVKSANDQMAQYASTQRALYGPKLAAAKTDAEKKQVYQAFNKTLSDKQEQLLKPLVDATKTATADAARKHNVLLVIDRADVLYGGTDITSDVQNDLK